MTSFQRDFLDFLSVMKGCSPHTISAYSDDLSTFFRYLMDEEKLAGCQMHPQNIEPSHIRRFLSFCRHERGNSNRTLARKLSALKSFYRFLNQHTDGEITIDPTARFPAIKFARHLPVYFSLDEARSFINFIAQHGLHSERNVAIFTIFLHCGCRLSELVHLRLGDVDLESRTLRVLGKGQKERLIPLTEKATYTLQQYSKTRLGAPSRDRLFLNDRGEPYTSRQIQYLFTSLLEKSPVSKPGMTVHKLRHTCLTLLLAAGADMRSLKEIAGHADISTTQLYTHVTQAHLQQTITKHPLG